jgi:hypothetical protein
MNDYLSYDHPDAFVDWPKRQPPLDWYPDRTTECPVCQGHGGWNLTLNAYPLHHYADTPENRHLHAHFRCHCTQCHGYGWVEPAEARCIHQYDRELRVQECRDKGIYHAGMCWHVYECSKCGAILTQDSSD